MAKQIILTQNNFGIPIELQFVSDTNSPVDLTDKTVEVAISYDGTIIDVLQATISSYTNGTAYIIVNTKHTSNVGLYTTFWSVRDEYGYITAQSDLYYYVKEEYNGAETPGIEQDKGTIEEKLNEVNSSIGLLNEENSVISTRVSGIEIINSQLTNNIETINSQMDTIANRFVTPEMYGAKGDGVTDDTIAFKTACSKKKGVMLTGKYRITSQCELYNVNIFSLNNGSIVCDTGSEFTLNLTGNSAIESVIFSGVNCILITNLRNKVYNCTFGKYGSERVGTHIKFKGTEWYGENIIDKNMFIGGGEYNIDFRENTHPATDNYITNNVFAYSKNSIIGTVCGTIISHNHDYSIEGMYINGNDIKIDNNYFDNGNHTSIDISAQSSLSICNNVFYSTTNDTVDLINFRRGINCICTGNTVGGYTGDVTLFNLNNFYFKSSFENNQCKKIAKNISNETMIASKGLSGETTFYYNDEQYTLTQKISNNMVFVNINSNGTFAKGKIGRIGLTGFPSDTILSMSCNEGIGFAKLYGSTGEIHILTPKSASNISIVGTIPY